MSFRRPEKAIHEQARHWEQWRNEHRAALERTGLPELVLQDEEHWWDFLLHGYLDHHPDPLRFSVRQLSREQQCELRQFLHQILSPDEKASAIVLLQIERTA